tara:strand:- start:1244 stop:1438 length:195 start_codon:yes stop_codon:yes gene_type:complete
MQSRVDRINQSNRGKKMTKTEAEKLGWTFEGGGDDVTAEMGRLIFVGPLEVVLFMIKSTSEQTA